MKALLFDFSRTLLFPKGELDGVTLNQRHKQLSDEDASYPFFDHFELNQELLDLIHQFKDRFTPYIFTSGFIQDAEALKPYLKDFKEIYSAAKIGKNKRDPATYTWLAQDIGLPPEEILFIDDSQGNIDAAKEAGMEAMVYSKNKEVIEKITRS